jgi:hypothetical protein
MSSKERSNYDDFRYFMSVGRRFWSEGDYPVTGDEIRVVCKGRNWPPVMRDGTYPYVVLPDGEVRFSRFPRPECSIHHPELCREQEVVGAGMFRVCEGEIVKISNESGHYRPDVDSLVYTKKAFGHWGAPLAENAQFDGNWVLRSTG